MTEQFKLSEELKPIIFILNQIFEIEKKLVKIKEKNSIMRNVEKLKEYFETGFLGMDLSITYHNPIGEKYDETRTDCEASIAGTSDEDLVITEVIKPIIRIKQHGRTFIIQRAVVIVESINKGE